MLKSEAENVVVDTEAFVAKVVTSRLQLKRVMRDEQLFDLSEQVLQCRDQVVEGENPPQILFPEEIWKNIFEMLAADFNSVRNCYNTCRLFRKYMEPQSKLILFRKVLHILFSGNYLHKVDLFNCRRVSRLLCACVDNFLESKESWTKLQWPQDKFMSIRVPRIKYYLKFDHNNVHGGIADHAQNQNLIISRYVRAHLMHESSIENGLNTCGQYIWYMNYEGIPDHTTLNPFIGRSVKAHLIDESSTENNFNNCGKYIWYLSINVSASHMGTVLITLRHCTKLRRLQISDLSKDFPRRESLPMLSSFVNEELCFDSIKTFNLPYLTSILMIPDFGGSAKRYQKPNINFLQLQDSLVQKFSNQLEELRVMKWNPEYSGVEWSKLRILQIERCNSVQDMKSLYRMKAVKLRRLSLKMHGSNTEFLQLLLQTIYHFPQLEELLLEFDWQCEISEGEITALPVSLPDICSSSLKRLHLRTGVFDKITYSFLLYFPFLEYLHISYHCEELDSEEIVTDPDSHFGFYTEQSAQQEMYTRTKAMRDIEVLKIRKYIYTQRDKFHQSNVWQVLPFLRSVKITQFWSSFGRWFTKTTDYPRAI